MANETVTFFEPELQPRVQAALRAGNFYICRIDETRDLEAEYAEQEARLEEQRLSLIGRARRRFEIAAFGRSQPEKRYLPPRSPRSGPRRRR